jgi:hypothetical protein
MPELPRPQPDPPERAEPPSGKTLDRLGRRGDHHARRAGGDRQGEQFRLRRDGRPATEGPARGRCRHARRGSSRSWARTSGSSAAWRATGCPRRPGGCVRGAFGRRWRSPGRASAPADRAQTDSLRCSRSVCLIARSQVPRHGCSRVRLSMRRASCAAPASRRWLTVRRQTA